MNHPTKTERIIRTAVFCACEVFAVCTLFMMPASGEPSKLLMCFATILLVCAPGICERVLFCKISTPVYIFFLLYAIGPMLGYCHNLYYLTNWWDKLLHTCGGVAFALLGLYLFQLLNGQKQNVVLCAVFAFCFSVTLSVLWEFFEFGADIFTGTDMQNDTVVTSITSYYLSDVLGAVGTIDQISQVTVNGTMLPVQGYLDIGLIDSMLDMLLETLGALVVAVLSIADKGRHPMFVSVDRKVAQVQKGRSQ